MQPAHTLPKIKKVAGDHWSRLRVTVGAERWIVTVRGDDDNTFEIHCFEASTQDRKLIPGDDAADTRWVAPDALGEYPLTAGLEERIRALLRTGA